MERSESGGRLELLQHRSINQAMLPQLWPAMHDSMPDSVRRRHFRVGEEFCDSDDSVPLAGNCMASESKELFCESFA